MAEFGEKAAQKEMATGLKRSGVSPPSGQEQGMPMMSRLGAPVDKTAPKLKINRKTARKYLKKDVLATR